MEKLTQNYSKYTDEDRHVWGLLYNRQMDVLKELASKSYLDAIKTIDFRGDKIPDFDEVNKKLLSLTGWSLEVVPSIVEKKLFFELLSQQRFPATSWLRTLKQLDYIEEPDMFHDVFAHIPLLTNPGYCKFFKELSDIAIAYHEDDKAIELLGRIYWFTIEFGLIREAGKTKIYGAGILSSQGESRFCVSPLSTHYEFDTAHILDSPYRTDIMQGKYFIVQSFEQLYNSLPDVERLIDIRLGQKAV